MLWTKNKENKKAGTTIIGVRLDETAAIGTDFDSAKPDGEAISCVKACVAALVGWTGTNEGLALAEKSLECLSEDCEYELAIEKITSFWKNDDKISAINGHLLVLTREKAYKITNGEPSLVESGVIAVGPGEEYALAAIRAVLSQPVVKESAKEVVEKAFKVASGVCILVNPKATVISL